MGSRDGIEVPQLYLGFPSNAGEPPKVLRDFGKFFIGAGQVADVTFSLHTRDLSIWDVTTDNWKFIPGTYQVDIGASSRDTRVSTTISITNPPSSSGQVTLSENF